MKKIILLFVASLVTGWIYGQGEMDAFRLSGTDMSGSARGVAMGGAFGALGGDITGITQNPAGIGVYRSSEIVGTLNLTSTNTRTNTLGTIGKDYKTSFNFNNLAYVAYMPIAGSINAFNFGFAYNRVNNFNRNYYAQGKGLTSSLTDYIASYTTRANVDASKLNSYYESGNFNSSPYDEFPWISVLGYNGGLINDNGDRYVSPLMEDKPSETLQAVDRIYSVWERGHIDTYDFTMGMNISNIVYLGAKFSITDMYYNLNSRYTEEFEHSEMFVGGGFDLDNDLETSGAGYQVSVGAIFRPVDEFRLGVAYHSPTWYNLNDYYYAKVYYEGYDPDVDSEWNYITANTPLNATDDYSFKTPDRWVVSAAGVLGGRAVVSVDYEYSDYSKMKLGDNSLFDNIYREQNDFISEDFIGASTVKAGLEFRATPQMSLRAGYAWMQSPLEESFKAGVVEVFPSGTVTAYTLDGDTQYYSCGIGYRFTPDFYMDLAFAYKTQTNQLYSYSPIFKEGFEVASVPSELKNDTYKGILTLGYRF